MNERIKELAKQASKEIWVTNPYNGAPEFDGYELDTEKFAELIVMESVRYFNEDYQRDFDTRWREDLSNGIKEHFGVR